MRCEMSHLIQFTPLACFLESKTYDVRNVIVSFVGLSHPVQPREVNTLYGACTKGMHGFLTNSLV